MRSAVGRVLATIVVFLPACAQIPTYETVAEHRGPPARHVVFVADGAGDYRACSAALRETALADGCPIEVVTFVWSHGYLRNIADHTDYPHARARGRELAEMVLAHRRGQPDVPVSLVGHSAGGGVALAAAESLPPDAVDRVILLSPSVSANYDIRPALTAARLGIDNFYSTRDRLWLGAFICLVGTMDDRFAVRTAGRFGFTCRAGDGPDDPAYARLRQHRWEPARRRLGHNGDHYGAYQPEHLRRFVMPLYK